jgi:hypothetical protein
VPRPAACAVAAALLSALAGSGPARAESEKTQEFHRGLYDALVAIEPAVDAVDPARLAALQRRDMCANGAGPLTSLRHRIAGARVTIARAFVHRSRDLAIYSAFSAGELLTGIDADLIERWLRADPDVAAAVAEVTRLERAATRAAPATARDQLGAAADVEELVVATTRAAAIAGRRIADTLRGVDAELALMLRALRRLEPADTVGRDLWPPVDICRDPDAITGPRPPATPQPTSSCAGCTGSRSSSIALALIIIAATIVVRRA